MLEIKAVTYNDLAPVVPISKTIPPEGGTIGRGPDNVLSLPDPMRLISRQHLHVIPDGSGGYRLINISSANIVYVNSAELRPGQNCALSAGDKIYIGGYLLQVQLENPLQKDLSSISPPAQSEKTDVLRSPVPTNSAAVESIDDFITDLLGPATLSHQDQTTPTMLADDPLEAILDADSHDDSDPMHTLQANGVGLRDLTEKGDLLINHSNDDIDHTKDLLQDTSGLPASMLPNSVVDPLAFFNNGGDNPFQESNLTKQNTPADTLAAGEDAVGLAQIFQVPQKVSAPQQIVETSPIPDGYGSLDQPDPKKASSATTNHETNNLSGSLSGIAAEDPIDDPLQQFLNEPSGDMRDVLNDPLGNLLGTTIPQNNSNAVPDIQTQLSSNSNESLLSSLFETDNASTQPASRSQVPEESTSNQMKQENKELYQALLKGLGLKEIPDRCGLDLDFMYLLGKLLRCSAQGTVDLMAGRAVIKREVRANVTLIAPERNNPLKFSPDGEVAIMYLLGRTYPGFMQPTEAMENAYLDLRAHQMGLVSGMRSALEHVLDKFDPKVIENTTIENRSILGLPVARKARLWEAYQNYFQTTRNEAQDRFQEFFGQAFLKAYDEATASLDPKHIVKPAGDQ